MKAATASGNGVWRGGCGSKLAAASEMSPHPA